MTMRVLLAAMMWAFGAAFASADEITLDARAGAPVVEVMINDRPARMLIETRLPDVAVMNPAAARRLGLRPIPMVSAAVGLDGDVVLQGRIARPNIRFANGETRRVLTGLFGIAASARADGVMGPGALPYDVVRLVLRDGPEGAVTRTVPLRNADVWQWRDALGGHEMSITFDLDREGAFFSRRAATYLARDGAFVTEGAIARTPYIIGIAVDAQPVRAPLLNTNGFAFGAGFAHTDSPLVLPDDADAIVVTARAEENDPPSAHLGRAALAGCSDIVVHRAARTLSAHCDQ